VEGARERGEQPLDNAAAICDTTATDASDRFTTEWAGVVKTHDEGVDWSVTSDRPSGPFSPQQAHLNN
jgi:hypothetical protein